VTFLDNIKEELCVVSICIEYHLQGTRTLSKAQTQQVIQLPETASSVYNFARNQDFIQNICRR